MRGTRLSVISFLIILVLYYSCTSVTVTKHPDYYYFPTNPNSVRIYDRLMPAHKFIIIGRINVDATWTVSNREMNKKIQEKAASIGGDGVIITHIQVDTEAYNRSVTTNGTLTEKGNKLEYYAVSRDTSFYLTTTQLYGYVIKRQKQFSTIANGKSYKNTRITVKILRIKAYLEFTLQVGTSEIITLRIAEATDSSWLKPEMNVEMLYVNDNDVRLYRADGRSIRFKRIK